MDSVRRKFLRGAVAALAFPATAMSATWDQLGCICRKIGAHFSICRKHWKDSTDEDFRVHLMDTHTHLHDRAKLARFTRDDLYALHDVHHEGGTFNRKGINITISKPSASRHYHRNKDGTLTQTR